MNWASEKSSICLRRALMPLNYQKWERLFCASTLLHFILYLASAQQLSMQCTNRDDTYEAMKRTMKTSMEYKRTIHVKNLYQELKKDGIGTTKVEMVSRRMCQTVPRNTPFSPYSFLVEFNTFGQRKFMRAYRRS